MLEEDENLRPDFLQLTQLNSHYHFLKGDSLTLTSQ